MADVGYKNRNDIDIYSITSQVTLSGHSLTYFNELFFYKITSSSSKQNIKVVSYNPYNCHEKPYYFGSDHGYYFGAARTDAAVATKESLLRLKCGTTGSGQDNTSYYRALSGSNSDYYIFYRDGKFNIYRSFSIGGTTAYPNDNDKVNWYLDTKYDSERVVIVLTGGGGGGGACYSGHDGPGGGGAGTVIATLNLSKVRENTDSWYHIKIGAGGSKSSGDWGTGGSAGGQSSLYYGWVTSPNNYTEVTIAYATGGKGGKGANGGEGGWGNINADYFASSGSTFYHDACLFATPGLSYAYPTVPMPHDTWWSCTFGTGGKGGAMAVNGGASQEASVSPSYTTNGSGPVSSYIKFYHAGGYSQSNAGGGGGASLLGSGGKGGVADWSTGDVGTGAGSGGGGARYQWGNGGTGANGKGGAIRFYYER